MLCVPLPDSEVYDVSLRCLSFFWASFRLESLMNFLLFDVTFTWIIPFWHSRALIPQWKGRGLLTFYLVVLLSLKCSPIPSSVWRRSTYVLHSRGLWLPKYFCKAIVYTWIGTDRSSKVTWQSIWFLCVFLPQFLPLEINCRWYNLFFFPLRKTETKSIPLR